VNKRYVSVRDYAAAYGVSVATVYAMCATGKLPHVRLGTGRGTIRIPEDAVTQDKGSVPGRPEPPAAPVGTKRVKPHYLRLPS
jgi:excisionase family DNA binding protein